MIPEPYAYTIPNKYFAPHKVIIPFTARVAYEIVNGKIKIIEVGLSESAVKYVKTSPQLVNDIRKEMESKLLPVRNAHVNETIMAAIAPHI
jgi:hypothetical protein